MKEIYISIVTVAFLLTSCFKDDSSFGSDNVIKVDEISGIDEEYTIAKYTEELIINPEIVFNNEEAAHSDFSYEWYFLVRKDGEMIKLPVSDEKELTTLIEFEELPFGSNTMAFEVVNNRSGLKHVHGFRVNLINDFMMGDYFLYENGTEASEVLLINHKNDVYPDLYSRHTHDLIKGHPIGFHEVKKDLKGTRDLLIITDDNSSFGKIYNVDNLISLGDLNQIFASEAPDALTKEDKFFSTLPKTFYTSGDVRYLINGNFYYYFTGNDVGLIKPQVSLSLPKQRNIDYMSHWNGGMVFLHNQSSGNIYYNYRATSTSFMRAKVEGSSGYASITGNCLHICKAPGSDWEDGVIAYMFVKEGSDVVIYKLDGKTYKTGSANNVVLSNSSPVKFSRPDLLTETTICTQSNAVNYVYFSNNNIVYRYRFNTTDPAQQPEEFIVFPQGEEVTLLEMRGDVHTVTDDKLVIATYKPGQANDEGATIYFYDRDGQLLKDNNGQDMMYPNVSGKIHNYVWR